jgi:hypothetical protein
MNRKLTLWIIAIALVVVAAIGVTACTTTVGVGVGVPVSSGWYGPYNGPYGSGPGRGIW